MTIDLHSATLPLFQALLVNLYPSSSRPNTSDADSFDLFESLLLPPSLIRPIPSEELLSSSSPSATTTTHQSSGAIPKRSPCRGRQRAKPHSFDSRQTKTLLSILSFDDQLSQAEKELVGLILGLSSNQVNRWFCNARARELKRSKKFCELERSEGWSNNPNYLLRNDGPSQTVHDQQRDPLQLIDPRLLQLTPSTPPPPPRPQTGPSRLIETAPHRRECNVDDRHTETCTFTPPFSIPTPDGNSFGPEELSNPNSPSSCSSRSWRSEVNDRHDWKDQSIGYDQLKASPIGLGFGANPVDGAFAHSHEHVHRGLWQDGPCRTGRNGMEWTGGLAINDPNTTQSVQDNYQFQFDFLDPLSINFLTPDEASRPGDNTQTIDLGLKLLPPTQLDYADQPDFFDLINHYSPGDSFGRHPTNFNSNPLQLISTSNEDPQPFCWPFERFAFSPDPSSTSSSSPLSSSPPIQIDDLD